MNVCGSTTKDGMAKSKFEPCGVCRVKGNSDLCVLCGKWIHGKRAGVKIVTEKELLERHWREKKVM